MDDLEARLVSAFAAASEASTSDSNAPDSASSASVKPTSGDAESSPATGPESPAGPTSAVSLFNPYRTEPGEWVEGFKEDTIHDALTKNPPPKGPPLLLISSAADSPAKTSASPDAAPDSKLAADPACSSSAPASLTLFSPLGDGSCLRTFPDSFPLSAAGISPSFSRRWPTSGFTTSPGECWTADTSESPNAAAAYSSLRDVLEEAVPQRYFLSQKAAAGILRRAQKRGRELPSHLSAALAAVARTTTTDRPDGS